MKTKMLNLRIFGLLAMLTFSLVSCSDDGDDNGASFLEKHGGTVWKFSQEGGTIYAKINDSESNSFEIWASLFDACYIYESLAEAGNTQVLENTENKIVIRIDEGASEYTLLTLTVVGEILTINSEYYEDDVLEEDELFILKETSDNVSDLELCELS
jgi:hypothetical protein